MEALSIGALEVMSKPSSAYSVGEMSVQLIDKIRAVAGIKVKATGAANTEVNMPEKKMTKALGETTNKIIAIGASTGGTEALKVVLTGMPPNAPEFLLFSICRHILRRHLLIG